jgi:hypothetical protein
MITKERLLAGLQELVYVEEGMITLYANFSKALVGHAEGMEANKKKEIEKLLSRLYRDSSRHKETVDEMLKNVEAGVKNEY